MWRIVLVGFVMLLFGLVDSCVVLRWFVQSSSPMLHRPPVEEEKHHCVGVVVCLSLVGSIAGIVSTMLILLYE